MTSAEQEFEKKTVSLVMFIFAFITQVIVWTMAFLLIPVYYLER